MAIETSLKNRLTQLNLLGDEIAECLLIEAERLEQNGHPPSQQLLDNAADYRLQLEELTEQVCIDADADDFSVEQLASLLNELEAHTKANRVIDSLLGLHTTSTETGLETVQEAAIVFQEQLATQEYDPETLEQLVQDSHVWCSLIRLVSDGDTLQDDVWDQLSSQVREELGNTLATAALRGKILPLTQQVTSDAVNETQNASAASKRNEEPVDSKSSSSPAHASDNIFDEVIDNQDVMSPQDRSEAKEDLTGTVLTVAHSLTNSALFEDDEPAEPVTPEAFELSEHQCFIDPDGPLGDSAREAIRGDRFVRGEKLTKVVLHLILEGRSGLAWHLARSMETAEYPFTRSFPAWMIHAWTLGHAVIFQRGQLASMLSSDFAKASPVEGDGSLRIAQELFARAVTLRPSIVTPNTGANNILRSFAMEPETTQIFNYCSRIGKYGEQIQGLLPGLFRTAGSDADRTDQLQTLQQDIRKWQSEISERSFRYEPAKPLFLHANWTLKAGTTQRYPSEVYELQQWQVTVQRGERIVLPILENRRDDAQEVRTELERLSADLRHADDQQRNSNTLPAEEMRTYLRRAMSFAQRWLAMLSPGNGGEGFISQAAIELKTELEERHEAVAEEVQELMQKHHCFELDVAGACFLLAMDQVKDLFSVDAQVADQEADPRHLVHSEFLKMPSMKLNSQWEPTCDLTLLEDSILEFLSRPQPDWLTAFQLQVNYGNIESAEKIVGLGTCSASERSQLQAMLNQYIKSQRDQLWSDLEETEASINEAVRLEILSEQDRSGFAARVEKLRRGLKTGHEFSVEVQEIEQLQEQLKIRRERAANRTLSEDSELDTQDAEDQEGWVMDFTGGNH